MDCTSVDYLFVSIVFFFSFVLTKNIVVHQTTTTTIILPVHQMHFTDLDDYIFVSFELHVDRSDIWILSDVLVDYLVFELESFKLRQAIRLMNG